MLKLISSKISQSRFYSRNSRFQTRIARSDIDRERCRALRDRLMFANSPQNRTSTASTFDQHVDPVCDHVMVIERDTGKLIATTRILSPDNANKIGYFMASSNFQLSELFHSSSRVSEIDILYIERTLKTQPVFQALWLGISKALANIECDYVIATERIHYHTDLIYPRALNATLKQRYAISNNLKVEPLSKLPYARQTFTQQVVLPTSLANYIHLGAAVCGDAYHDANRQFIDLVLFIDAEKILINDTHYSVMGE